MTSRNTRSLRIVGRGGETLEDRALLAGHGFGGFWHGGPGAMALAEFAGPFAGFFSANQFRAAHDSVFAGWGHHGYEENGTRLTASLSDAETGATATVSYKSYVEDDETETELKVNVRGADADSTLDVTVGDTVVGQVTTDADGNGTLVLSSDPEDDEQSLPDDFPTDVTAGTAVSVGTLAGTLEEPTGDGGGCHGGDADVTTLRATIEDADTGATVRVKYRTLTTDEGTTTRLVVRVRDAEADSTLDVTIDDVLVSQITTDEDGNGSLVLSSDPQGDEQPLPADFPTDIAAGSTISVGTLSGTFETGGHHGGLRFGRFR